MASKIVLPIEITGIAEINRNLNSIDATLGNVADSLNKVALPTTLVKNIQDVNTQTLQLNEGVKNNNQSFNELGKTTSNLNLSALTNHLGGVVDSFNVADRTASKLTSSFGDFGNILTSILGLGALDALAGGIGLATSKLGIFGEQNNIISLALFGTGLALRQADNDFLKFVGTLSIAASVLLGAFSLAVQKVIILIGSFVQHLGEDIVAANQSALASFAKFETSTANFTGTLEALDRQFAGVIGSTAHWEEIIDELNKTTVHSVVSLQGATQEIVNSGTQIGLTTGQMEELLKVSVDYAAFSGKTLVEATRSVISGLKGNTEGLSTLAFNLNEASVAQHVYGGAAHGSLETLTDTQKVQARFSELMRQFPGIAGAATVQVNTLAGAQLLLAKRLEDANIAYGKGVAVVESTILLNKILADALNLVSPALIQVAGFISALGGRVLEVIGFFTKWIFTITVVTATIELLNKALASETAFKLFNTNILFINKSLLDLVKSGGAAGANLASLGGVLKALSSVVSTQVVKGFAFLANVSADTATFATITSGLFTRASGFIVSALSAIGSGLLALATNPITLVIAGIVLVFLALKKAFEEVELRTGVFTTLFEALKETLLATSPIFDSISEAIGKVGSFIKELVGKGLGLLVRGILAATQAVIDFGNAFDLFPDSQKVKLLEASARLKFLANDLDDVGNNLFALGSATDKANRKLAGLGADPKAIEELQKELDQLRESLDKIGKSDIQIIREEQVARLDVLSRALDAKLIKPLEGVKLKILIDQDALKRTQETITKGFENAGLSQIDILKNTEKERLSLIQEGLRIGALDTAKAAQLEALIRTSTAEQIATEEEKIHKESLKRQEEATKRSLDIIRSISEGLNAGLQVVASAILKPEIKVDIEPVLDQERALRDARIKALDAQFFEDERLINIQKDLGKISDDTATKQIAAARAQKEEEISKITTVSEKNQEAIKKEADVKKSALEKELKERDAASKLIADGFGKIADSFLPGIGPVVSTLTSLASQGSAAVVSTVEAIVAQIGPVLDVIIASIGPILVAISEQLGPLLISLFEALGPVLETIFANLGTILQNLFSQLDQIALAIVDALFKGIVSLSNNIDGIITKFTEGLLKALAGLIEKSPEVIAKMVEKAPEVMTKLSEPNVIAVFTAALVKSAPEIGRALVIGTVGLFLAPFVGFVNAIVDLINKIPGVDLKHVSGPDLSKFASGGEIPKGFPNDTFRASLSSGELVIDRSVSPKLLSFLDAQNGGSGTASSESDRKIDRLISALEKSGSKNLSIQMIVSEQELAKVLVNIDRQGIRTTG